MFNLPIGYERNHEAYYLEFAPYGWKFDIFIFEYALRTSEDNEYSFFRRYDDLMRIYNYRLYYKFKDTLDFKMEFNPFCMEYALVLLKECSNPFSLCRKDSKGYKMIFSYQYGLNEHSENSDDREWIFLALYSEVVEAVTQNTPKHISRVLYDEFSFNKIRDIITTQNIDTVVKKYINIASCRFCVVRVKQGKSYFFDERGIYCVIESDDDKCVSPYFFFSKWGGAESVELNVNIFKKAIAKVELGMTVNDFIEIYKNTKLEKHLKPTGLDRILYFEKPIFMRDPENDNEKTFDLIEIDIYICSENLGESLQAFEKKNRKAIAKKLGEKLMNNRSFKKYNIPLQFLRISQVQCTNSPKMIRYVLEIKQI